VFKLRTAALEAEDFFSYRLSQKSLGFFYLSSFLILDIVG